MNKQRGPGDDSDVWSRRTRGPTLDPDTCCGQGMWGETSGEKEYEMTFTAAWWPQPTHCRTTKHQTLLSDKVRGKILHTWDTHTQTHIQYIRLLWFLWTHIEEGREDYDYPHDDGLKNRPFIRHRSTITQCTHHFHTVIRMVSSTWLPGSESEIWLVARHYDASQTFYLFFCDSSLASFCDKYFFIYTWIREVVEWLHIWIDNHNLPVGCTTNKKLIPQREKALAAVKWLMVFWESSPVSKYPIEGSWKTPSFKEWVFDCLYEASLGYNTHSQLTKLISQTG